MGDCCQNDCGLDPNAARQRRTLRIVLAINAVMFVVIASAALIGSSNSLMADSLDNLGDALTYGLSLYAVSRAASVKSKVALFKGGLILAAALMVAGSIVYKLIVPTVPSFEMMGIFSLAGLAANAVCLAFLTRHRNEDVNMSSVWECSRNDIASNLSVFAAAGAVWLTGSMWPDLLIAAALIVILLRSAIRVNTSAICELRAAYNAAN
jgi:Co/Zn/Cd efflux system component